MKDKEKDNVVLTWQQKLEQLDEKLNEKDEKYQELQQQFDELKEEQIDKENDYIRENSEIMAKRELADNEIGFLREQLNEKDERIDQLTDIIDKLKSENDLKEQQVQEVIVLQEQNNNDNNSKDKEIEKYKLDYEHMNTLKENMEVNYQSLQKENINIINKNTEINKAYQLSKFAFKIMKFSNE